MTDGLSHGHHIIFFIAAANDHRHFGIRLGHELTFSEHNNQNLLQEERQKQPHRQPVKLKAGVNVRRLQDPQIQSRHQHFKTRAFHEFLIRHIESSSKLQIANEVSQLSGLGNNRIQGNLRLGIWRLRRGDLPVDFTDLRQHRLRFKALVGLELLQHRQLHLFGTAHLNQRRQTRGRF